MSFVGHTVRWTLNHFPRTCLQRAAKYIVPVLRLFYMGNGRDCPICGKHFRKFLPYGYGPSREDALCPGCLSLERHRLLWLYLKEEKHILDTFPKLLHIAPERCLQLLFEKHYGEARRSEYITADLESPLAALHFDVQDIPLEDSSVDVIICNHIMEHVDNDIKAMTELHRILKDDGFGIILSPVDSTLERTYEDPTITSPDERARAFGQYDHRRIYGRDYAERLERSGFRVEQIDYAGRYPEEERVRMALGKDMLYVVYKRIKENHESDTRN